MLGINTRTDVARCARQETLLRLLRLNVFLHSEIIGKSITWHCTYSSILCTVPVLYINNYSPWTTLAYGVQILQSGI